MAMFCGTGVAAAALTATIERQAHNSVKRGAKAIVD